MSNRNWSCANDRGAQDAFVAVMEDLGGDAVGRVEAWEAIQNSTAIIHGEPVLGAFMPKLFTEEAYGCLAGVARRVHRILTAVTARYRTDAAYRALFGFDERLEALIVESHRGPLIPIMRADIFLNEETGAFKFCEFNADGSSGINEDREVLAAIEPTATFQRFAADFTVEGNELFDSWIDSFAAAVREGWGRPLAGPVAIVDYADAATLSEIAVYEEAFRARGIAASFVDIRDLTYAGGVLRDGEGTAVDAVWRRCVPCDLLERWDESSAFVAAVRDGVVPVVGGFASAVAHDKRTFCVLRHPATRPLVSEEDWLFLEETIPLTLPLDEQAAASAEILSDKDRWIIKPVDGYGARDIHAGCTCAAEEWEATVRRLAAGPGRYVVQEYVRPYRSLLVPAFSAEELRAVAPGVLPGVPGCGMAHNLTGLYVFNGAMSGIYSRLGMGKVISGDYTAASVRVRPR
ncbi:circularly permuted type 2 ATP-grasp protein [Adlercreutzia mucosicola]|uniref:circularly permuted type 2 ATP-grasp protein n=1 Tax=Adlercreutzia mucosicola TaxID=580026 RepID=UPI000417E47D|nr:circularly permuted type 2 ATP-grasp protein [Adlercreutzia mucosicola]MCR2036033.1 circularly permuted type 2 ATP-grasp protein [Adlercreutzia mucosicola]